MRKLLLPAGAATLLLFAACGGSETTACGDPGGASMCPGSNCLDCHGFKVAGTVFTATTSTTPVSGATVRISPASGADVVLTTNSAGNFYTSASLAFPVTVTVTKGAAASTMGSGVPSGNGGCNGCHDGAMRIHP